jgi:signal peptidase I
MAQVKKKRNWLVIIGISTGVVAVLLLIGSATNTLRVFKTPTTSNLPNIKPGDFIWVSNLKKVERGRYITFLTFDSLQQGIATYLHRCVGIPGDKLQMKDGILYVNGSNFDKGLNLLHEYVLTSKYPGDYPTVSYLTEDEISYISPDGKSNIFLSTQKLNELKSELRKEDSIKQLIATESYYSAFFTEINHPEWTIDNFGPIKLPAECYFVLGDNRHGAMDSRFIGFIKKEKITGVVLK